MKKLCGCEKELFKSSFEQPQLFFPCVGSERLLSSVQKVRSYSYEQIALRSHQLLSLCRSFFGIIDVRLDGTSHPSGSRSTEIRLSLLLCDPCPVSRDPENLRFQAVSIGCLTERMVVNQPLVAHGVGDQDVDDLVELGWNG